MEHMNGHAVDLGPARRLLEKHLARVSPYDVTIAGINLSMLPEVFCPAFTNTSIFLAENVIVKDGETVLDMFTGSGFQGISAARNGGQVICTDKSKAAVACATMNVARNGFEGKAEVRLGDLYAPVEDMIFDVIIANPPLLPGIPRTTLEEAIFDPHLIASRRFLEGIPAHLTAHGIAYLVTSDVSVKADILPIDEICDSNALEDRIIAQRPVGYETYSVHEIRHIGGRLHGADRRDRGKFRVRP